MQIKKTQRHDSVSSRVCEDVKCHFKNRLPREWKDIVCVAVYPDMLWEPTKNSDTFHVGSPFISRWQRYASFWNHKHKQCPRKALRRHNSYTCKVERKKVRFYRGQASASFWYWKCSMLSSVIWQWLNLTSLLLQRKWSGIGANMCFQRGSHPGFLKVSERNLKSLSDLTTIDSPFLSDSLDSRPNSTQHG